MHSHAASTALLPLLLTLACAPATAADIHVRTSGDLQDALDAAKPGDTILLQPGVTFVGNFTLPVHGGREFVTVRSAANDSVLPPEGVRITPAHARHLPRIMSPNTGPALATAPGAAYWRLMFLELGPTERGYYDVVTLGDGSREQDTLAKVPHDLVIDRVYVHGDPLHGQKRGIALNSASTEIRNSHISDIKAIGQDSVAIGGWNGPGPYVIENNYLESAGEGFMLGGADPAIPDLVPTGVIFRQNLVSRPLAWRDPILPAPAGVKTAAGAGGKLAAGEYVYRVVAVRPAYDTTITSEPSPAATAGASSGARVTITWSAVPDATEYRVYVRPPSGEERYFTTDTATFVHDGGAAPAGTGTPPKAARWQVKNLLELKNARQVQIVGNTFEHNWQQAQSGVAILFTPRNQDGRCPWCVVEDVTFERNVVHGAGGGITILGTDNERNSLQTNAIRISHNLFTDLSTRWGGSAYFLYVFGGPRQVVVDHNTVISPDGSGVVNVDGPPVEGFVFTNNVARHNRYGIIASDHAPGLDTIDRFFPDAEIAGNVFADVGDNRYPGGIRAVAGAAFESQFVDYAGGDFRVRADSQWVRPGDAIPPGASIGALPQLDRPSR